MSHCSLLSLLSLSLCAPLFKPLAWLWADEAETDVFRDEPGVTAPPSDGALDGGADGGADLDGAVFDVGQLLSTVFLESPNLKTNPREVAVGFPVARARTTDVWMNRAKTKTTISMTNKARLPILM